jgi:hypothetical protein
MGNEERVSPGRVLGVSRRDLLRRGAVVGGTLLWATPVVQSLSPAAYAQMGPSPGACAACYCWNGAADKTEITGDQCADDGTVGFQLNRDECQRWCAHEGPYTGVAGAPGGPFQHSEYCSGANSCRCSSENDFDPTLTGVKCT